MKLLREPLVHFLAIGAAIYLFYGLFAEPMPDDDDKTIVVTAGEIEWMRTSWQKRWNRPPTPVFAAVRDRVTQDWTTDKGEALNEQFYASLRDQYSIVIEEPEQDVKVAAMQEPAR